MSKKFHSMQKGTIVIRHYKLQIHAQKSKNYFRNKYSTSGLSLESFQNNFKNFQNNFGNFLE